MAFVTADFSKYPSTYALNVINLDKKNAKLLATLKFNETN